MADGCLNFDTNINSEGFEKGLKSLSDMVGDIKPKLKSLAMAVTAAFSVKKLVDFGRQSIETASDLAEVQNVVDTAFGESKQSTPHLLSLINILLSLRSTWRSFLTRTKRLCSRSC